MFPRLASLNLAGNQLFAWADAEAPLIGRPATLPPAWTQPRYPVAFPQLGALVLYPGNDALW